MLEGLSGLSHISDLANLALKDVDDVCAIAIQPVLYLYFLFSCGCYECVSLYHPGADWAVSLVTSCGE